MRWTWDPEKDRVNRQKHRLRFQIAQLVFNDKVMPKLTEEQKAELKILEEMQEEDIDLSDIPDRPSDWPPPKCGLFYQPVKQQITLILDEYVIDWFEQNEPDEQSQYETINQALIEYIRDRKFPNRKRSKETLEQPNKGVPTKEQQP